MSEDEVEVTEDGPEGAIAPTYGGVTATLKFGKGYDEPWLVFRGVTVQDVRANIAEAMGWGLDSSNVVGLTLAQIVFNAAGEMQALGNIRKEFSGTRATRGRSARSEGRTATNDADPQGDPWDSVSEPTEGSSESELRENIEEILLAKIEELDTVRNAKVFYVDNSQKPEWTDAVDAAWRAKGKALSEQEKSGATAPATTE